MVYCDVMARCSFSDVAKLPSDSLAKVAAYDVDKVFTKTSKISEGAVINICHSLLKEWGTRVPRCPSRVWYAVTLDGVVNNVNYPPYVNSHPSHNLIPFKYYYKLIIISHFYFQGLTLLELSAHLEGKEARLRHEGLGKVKIALAGTNTSFLLDILEGCFGQQDADTPQSTISLEDAEANISVEDATSDTPGKTSPSISVSCGVAAAKLVFPLKSIPTVITGIPESFLPVGGLETLSYIDANFLLGPLSSLKKLLPVITFIMPTSTLHWHASIVALSTILNHVGIVPLLGSTILPPILMVTSPFIQMTLPSPNTLLVILETVLYHLPLDGEQISPMLLLSTNEQKLLNTS